MKSWMRLLPNVLVFLLISTACGAQLAPERDSFAVPSEIVPDSLVPTDPLAVYPESAECLIGVGRGVRVLLVSQDSAAEGSLHAGDIITSIDDVAIGSQEQLRSALQARSVGEVVTLAGMRSTQPFSSDVTLREATDGSEGIDIGVIAETNLEAVPPSEIDGAATSHQLTRPVVLDGEIYLHEPVGGSWSAYSGIPTQSMAGYRHDLYAIATTDPLALVQVGQGETIPIEVEIFTLNQGGAPLEVGATAFVEVLGSVGDVLVIRGGASPDDGGSIISVLYGVDPIGRVVVWNSPFPISTLGNLLLPISGFRSPGGGQVAVGIVERDPVTDATSDVVTYVLYDERGQSEIIPGSDGLPSNARVTGWFDGDSLAYVIPTETPQFVTWNTVTGEHTVLGILSEADAVGLLTIEPVGDGRHSVLVYETVTRLIDVIDTVVRRVSSQGCQYIPVGGLTGESG